MRRTGLAVAVLALVLPTAALAKGASQASISGPGLDKAIIIENEADTPLNPLAIQTGFYAAVFGQTPNPILAGRPNGALGPKYRITWTMPGPNNETHLIRQDVYPYAKGGAVTYMRPGQRFFAAGRTRGGWHQSPVLRQMLVTAGLPSPDLTGSSSGRDWSAPVGLGVIAALFALLAAGVLFRRRTHPAPAA